MKRKHLKYKPQIIESDMNEDDENENDENEEEEQTFEQKMDLHNKDCRLLSKIDILNTPKKQWKLPVNILVNQQKMMIIIKSLMI